MLDTRVLRGVVSKESTALSDSVSSIGQIVFFDPVPARTSIGQLPAACRAMRLFLLVLQPLRPPPRFTLHFAYA
jgi:hypothetical protein